MQITIVGGGFGGVKAALELSKDKKSQITLISDKPDFQYYPALFGTATGYSHLQSWVPLGQIFANRKNVTVVIDSIKTIDKAAQTLMGSSGVSYPYQTLILALGSVTTYFGIEGLDQYAYGIKSEDEISELKQHLFEEFSRANAVDKNFIVIGAGPTGVELASALGTYLNYLIEHYRKPEPKIKISLIEAAPRVLPRMSEAASKIVEARLKSLGVRVELGKKVESANADSLIVNGESIKSHTVVWTSGVANSPFFAANAAQFTLSKNGKVVVDNYLRADHNIYVIGDNAFTQFSGLAQTALRDAVFVARHILKKSKKKYIAKLPPVVVPVGRGWAIFEYKKLRFSGFIGSLIRHAADFIGYSDVLSISQALAVWHTQTIREDDPYISQGTAKK